MVERFRRRDFGHLDLEIMFEDPGAYTKPWTVATPLELFPDTELLEAVCKENEKDVAHMPGRPAGQRAEVKVAPEILAKYAGAYEIKEKGTVRPAIVSLAGDALFLDLDRTGPQHLVTMSETSFSQSGNVIQFVADDQGAITHFLIQMVEGEVRAIRKR